MNTKSLFVLFLFFLLATAGISQNESSSDTTRFLTFEELLDSSGMVFIAPEGYNEVQPVRNMQMNYEKAYMHPTARLEIRYAIRLHEYCFFEQIFMVTTLNISGGNLPEHTSFNPESAKEEFGANGGATVFVPLGEEFGMGYKYCLFVYIYKADVGDAYIFYLGDDRELISERMMDGFYALKYKK